MIIKMMKWLTNVPTELDKYIKQGLIIGRPHESDTYTVEELEEMGFVGVYTIVWDSDDRLDGQGDK